jgi:alanine-synthesizing transaminase
LRRAPLAAAFSTTLWITEVMDTEFYRMKRLPPYVIAEVNAMRAAARASGRDIIDLGMGNPDLPPPQHVIDKLCEVARDPAAHGYSQSKGIPGLRKAQASYYERRWGVDVDPESEVVVTLGSKEGLASLATAICAPGDTILAPNRAIRSTPSASSSPARASARCRPRPTSATGTRSTGRCASPRRGRPCWWSTTRRTRPPKWSTSRSTSGWSTGRRRTRSGCSRTSPTSELYYNGQPTPSILQAKGAKDVAIEFTSLSKTFSMAGWRIGFAVGNKTLIAALTRVKSYIDYGAFTPMQAAACAALNGPQDIVEKNRELYHKRRDVLVDAFGRAGWDIPAPPASMFAWAPLPPALKEMGSLEFSKQLLTHADVAVAPGVGYGEDGEGFVRIALVENEQRLRQAARNVKRYLQSMGVNASAA